MSVYEEIARALKDIARELKSIRRTLESNSRKDDPLAEALANLRERRAEDGGEKHIALRSSGKIFALKSPGTCFMTEEPCNVCCQMKDDGCEYLVRPGEPWPEDYIADDGVIPCVNPYTVKEDGENG